MATAWYYHPGFKAYHSWDYDLIEPLVFTFIRNKRFPGIISFNYIWDILQKKMPERANEVHAKQCISRTLKLAGYRKESERGKAWYLISIMSLDIRSCFSHQQRKQRRDSHRCVPLVNFYPDLIPVY
jgi:hypothetical protein